MYENDFVEVDGKKVRIKDIDDKFLRAMFGVGHFGYPGREIVYVRDVEWPYKPEQCPTEEYKCKWFYNGTFLLCTGCGLDCT